MGTAILGTVLSVTLASAFAANLAGGPLAGAGAPGGQSAAPASVGDVETTVRAAMDTRFAALQVAIEAGDEAAVRTELTDVGVPVVGQEAILQGLAATANEPEARAGLISQLRERFEAQADQVVEAVGQGVRASFASAVTRVFFYVQFIVVAAWLITLALPVLPLRAENAPRVEPG